MLSKEVIIVICVIVFQILMWKTFDLVIFPWILNRRTKDIEINPKWITSKAKDVYGFHNIDFVIVNSPLGMLPRFRVTKDKKRLQMLLSENTTTDEVERLLCVALNTKIKILYGVWYPEKPLYWLSVLCFMLDGGDLHQESLSWGNKEKDKKPIDLI